MLRGKVTERTFYPVLMDVIREAGGSGVQEVLYVSEPDIVFTLGRRQWLLSVKIGEDLRTLRDAFLQYQRHKDDSGIGFGMLLFLPERVRDLPAEEQVLKNAVSTYVVTALVDAGIVKEELRDRAFPEVIRFLQDSVIARLTRKESKYYSLPFVVNLLKQQVEDLMAEITLSDAKVLDITTHPDLLMELGHLDREEAEKVAEFLGSYILMSQILFLRLLFAARPDIFPDPLRPTSKSTLRRAFERILDINYRPIYAVDVLDNVGEMHTRDTFDLIWGLEVERVRHELPGRIFHELMPLNIRKMLAAFYTRPLAADLLASLSIQRSDESLFDLACGSGTILVAGYKRKTQLHAKEGLIGNPHARFCESEIFGADIMPFSVHLTSANLSAMDAGTTIARTQIFQKDSMALHLGDVCESGVQLSWAFHAAAPVGETAGGDKYEVPLRQVDTVLMNPPFTKVERGIAKYVDMKRFRERCGGEVGLWGHFIGLANEFLLDDGIFGAVIPINVLRGRESAQVRKIIFRDWTPLYIIKATQNYAFSEWSEYRDILVIARKTPSQPSDRVKIGLVKGDLAAMTERDIAHLETQIKTHETLRSDSLDIDTHEVAELAPRMNNLMWFCGGVDLDARALLVDFVDRFRETLQPFPEDYFRTGFRPDKGVSKFLFLTRRLNDERVAQAFLRFGSEDRDAVRTYTPTGKEFAIERRALRPSLRTPVGLNCLDVGNTWDYIAREPYRDVELVQRAAGIRPLRGKTSRSFWTRLPSQLDQVTSHVAVVCRFNPFSPAQSLFAVYSKEPLCPTDQFNVLLESDEQRSKALCLLLNSVAFLAMFFLLKEESSGRFVHIRVHDLMEMALYPGPDVVNRLSKIFDKHARVGFPPLSQQLDANFEDRYTQYWEDRSGSNQVRFPGMSMADRPISPSEQRLRLDLDVCQAVGVPVSEEELLSVYTPIVNEMMIVRHLQHD